jgi:hypothetical protein
MVGFLTLQLPALEPASVQSAPVANFGAVKFNPE